MKNCPFSLLCDRRQTTFRASLINTQFSGEILEKPLKFQFQSFLLLWPEKGAQEILHRNFEKTNNRFGTYTEHLRLLQILGLQLKKLRSY